jgi:hypothetical protein
VVAAQAVAPQVHLAQQVLGRLVRPVPVRRGRLTLLARQARRQEQEPRALPEQRAHLERQPEQARLAQPLEQVLRAGLALLAPLALAPELRPESTTT